MPKYLIASGKHSAALFPHKLRVWQPQGEKSATQLCSSILLEHLCAFLQSLQHYRIHVPYSRSEERCALLRYPLLIEQSLPTSYCCNQQTYEIVLAPHIYHPLNLNTTREMLSAQHEKSLELHPQ